MSPVVDGGGGVVGGRGTRSAVDQYESAGDRGAVSENETLGQLPSILMEATVQEPKPNVILRLPGHGWDGGSPAIDDPGLSMVTAPERPSAFGYHPIASFARVNPVNVAR